MVKRKAGTKRARPAAAAATKAEDVDASPADATPTDQEQHQEKGDGQVTEGAATLVGAAGEGDSPRIKKARIDRSGGGDAHLDDQTSDEQKQATGVALGEQIAEQQQGGMEGITAGQQQQQPQQQQLFRGQDLLSPPGASSNTADSDATPAAAAVVVEEGSNTPPQHGQVHMAKSDTDEIMEPALAAEQQDQRHRHQQQRQVAPGDQADEEEKQQGFSSKMPPTGPTAVTPGGGSSLPGVRGGRKQSPQKLPTAHDGWADGQRPSSSSRASMSQQQQQQPHQTSRSRQRQPASGESAAQLEGRSKQQSGPPFFQPGPPAYAQRHSSRSQHQSKSRSGGRQQAPRSSTMPRRQAPFTGGMPPPGMDPDRPLMDLVTEGLMFREWVDPSTQLLDASVAEMMEGYHSAMNYFSFQWDRHPTTAEEARAITQEMLQEIDLGQGQLDQLSVQADDERRHAVAQSHEVFKQNVLTRSELYETREQTLAEEITKIEEAERQMEHLCRQPLH